MLVAYINNTYIMFIYLPYRIGISFLIYETWVRIMAGGVRGVWIGFAAFQWIRLVIFSNRVNKVKRSIIV